MSDLSLLAALLAGLIGSGHCVAMCGAIAAGPSLVRGAENQPPPTLRALLWRRLQYNAGRIASYAVAGVLVGTAGMLAGDSLQGIVDTLGGALPAGALLRLLAAAMVVLVGLRLMCQWAWLRWPERLGAKVYGRLAPRLQLWLGRRAGGAGDARGRASALADAGRRVALGGLWGWMPCGLSYTLLLVALVSGSPLKGAGVMLAFGLGTLPAMLGVGMLAGTWRRLRSPLAASVAGWLLVAFGSFAVTATGETLVTAMKAAPNRVLASPGDLVVTDAYCGLPHARRDGR